MANQSLEERKRRFLETFRNEYTPEQQSAATAILSLFFYEPAEHMPELESEACTPAETAEQARIDQAAAQLLKDVDI